MGVFGRLVREKLAGAPPRQGILSALPIPRPTELFPRPSFGPTGKQQLLPPIIDAKTGRRIFQPQATEYLLPEAADAIRAKNYRLSDHAARLNSVASRRLPNARTGEPLTPQQALVRRLRESALARAREADQHRRFLEDPSVSPRLQASIPSTASPERLLTEHPAATDARKFFGIADPYAGVRRPGPAFPPREVSPSSYPNAMPPAYYDLVRRIKEKARPAVDAGSRMLRDLLGVPDL